MGKFDEILFCCVKILGYNTLLKFWTILESTTMFLMKNALLSNEKNAAIVDYHMAAEEAAMNAKQKLY